MSHGTLTDKLGDYSPLKAPETLSAVTHLPSPIRYLQTALFPGKDVTHRLFHNCSSYLCLFFFGTRFLYSILFYLIEEGPFGGPGPPSQLWAFESIGYEPG